MAEPEDQERRTEEYVKLCYESFKHLTTLSTAGALVILAVYREVSIEIWLVTVTLALFAVTLLISVFSMLLAAGYFSPRANPVSVLVLVWCLTVASMCFVLAVGVFMLIPVELPKWTAPTSLIALLFLLDTMVVLPVYRFLRQRRGSPVPQGGSQD